MKVVVTGGSGLIGTALLNELNGKCDVVGLTRGKPKKNLVKTDYSKEDLVSNFFDADVIVHLAAIRGKSEDYQHFIENETLTENVLKAAIEANAKRVIYMSSIAVYSNQNLLPWKENQAVQPQTFYGLSKIVGEHLCELYSRTGINYTVFRCGIVLGVTNNNRMTDIFIQRASEKETITVSGKSVAKRDFIYIKDVVKAISWDIFDNCHRNEVFNLGCGTAYTNLEIAKMTNKVFGNEGNIVYRDDLPEGLVDSRMDSSKLERYGFTRKYNLETALMDIKAEWSRNVI